MTESKKMLLITNDDGINAKGLTKLAAALEKDFDVWVVAPDRERSAISHAISIMSPMAVHKKGAQRYSISGTPADCVWLAHRKLLPRKPDWVVSGVNAGGNLGSDVLYSGTVQAAAEGMIMGSNALAVSADYTPEGCNFDTVTAFAVELLKKLVSLEFSAPALINVNGPYTPPKGPHPEKFRFTRLGQRNYITNVQTLTDARKREYYWAEGHIEGHLDIPNSDCEALADGLFSVTPIQLDMTGYSLFEKLDKEITVEGYAGEPYAGDLKTIQPHNFNGVR